jgi:hypothetical protein
LAGSARAFSANVSSLTAESMSPGDTISMAAISSWPLTCRTVTALAFAT